MGIKLLIELCFFFGLLQIYLLVGSFELLWNDKKFRTRSGDLLQHDSPEGQRQSGMIREVWNDKDNTEGQMKEPEGFGKRIGIKQMAIIIQGELNRIYLCIFK